MRRCSRRRPRSWFLVVQRLTARPPLLSCIDYEAVGESSPPGGFFSFPSWLCFCYVGLPGSRLEVASAYRCSGSHLRCVRPPLSGPAAPPLRSAILPVTATCHGGIDKAAS